MRPFQGSGFSINLPDDTQDASYYNFVLPTKEQFSPYINIRFTRVNEAQKLEQFANDNETLLEENVENFKRLERVAGKQQGRDTVISLVEWGKEEGKIRQRFIYLLDIQNKSRRIYTITATDLATNFKTSLPKMIQIIKSFTFNDIQIYD